MPPFQDPLQFFIKYIGDDSYHDIMQIAVHHEGVFYEFVPWNGVVSWEISPWGHWCLSAENKTHKVIVYLQKLRV